MIHTGIHFGEKYKNNLGYRSSLPKKGKKHSYHSISFMYMYTEKRKNISICMSSEIC
jgi:hypothetical protein